ncbi:metal tolerance protein C2 isoform X2 [Citrus clementina]|uniref:metal tolerance protein C2 isoform X2 n=1 Tax=Citrus clementina TaxID=85681 RepID=UPI000CED3865|nr:metal tolerance protein C2 isoform X2 [Citrus x clementina]
MEKTKSFKYHTQESNLGLSTTDRRLAYVRQASYNQSQLQEPPHTPISIFPDESAKPFLSRSISNIDTISHHDKYFEKLSCFRALRSGNRQMKRLFLLISLNVAYSTAELAIGLFTGRVGLVSDAFHLTFGCGLLTFSMFAMAASRQKPDFAYTYGYKRLEVLSAFTNAFATCLDSCFFCSCHSPWLWKHFMHSYKTNLSTIYRNPEDMNYHSVCLHVLADSIRSAGLILASWFLSLGVQNAEVLCLGIVSVAVFMLVMPLFKVTGGILLQMAPPSIPSSALSKCWRQIVSREDVTEVSQARFWELVPGHVVGSLSLQVKKGVDDRPILQFVHGLYHDLGVQDLTVQIDYD